MAKLSCRHLHSANTTPSSLLNHLYVFPCTPPLPPHHPDPVPVECSGDDRQLPLVELSVETTARTCPFRSK
ncbi:hypothetical protein B0H12DRAFT_595499 [Mycena haematopus]|nr:hypothetical protein B0H12DRAFT_595499 [Mycena haematopus]